VWGWVFAACQPTQYKCVNAICIDISWWCDGYRDCPGGDDEKPDCKDGVFNFVYYCVCNTNTTSYILVVRQVIY